MSEFITVEINYDKCVGIKKCGRCIKVCPVSIFSSNGNYPKTLEANEDECTLCALCLQNCKVSAITIHKLYED